MTPSTHVERRRTRARRALLSLSTILCPGLAVPATAQSFSFDPPYVDLDPNGVDYVSGTLQFQLPTTTIGRDQLSLSYTDRASISGGGSIWKDSFTGILMTHPLAPDYVHVEYDGIATTFYTRTYSRDVRTGSSISVGPNKDYFLYSLKDGRTIRFDRYVSDGTLTVDRCYNSPTSGTSCSYVPTSVTFPSGIIYKLSYNVGRTCPGGSCGDWARISRVETNFGARVDYGYQSDTVPTLGDTAATLSWVQKTSVKIYRTDDITNGYLIQYSGDIFGYDSIILPTGALWKFNKAPGSSSEYPGQPIAPVVSIESPNLAAGKIELTYYDVTCPDEGDCSFTKVKTYKNGDRTTTYNRTANGSPYDSVSLTVNDASGQDTVVYKTQDVYSQFPQRPASITDPLQRTTSYEYDYYKRLTSVTFPEGGKLVYGYDTASNVSDVAQKVKTGYVGSDLTAHATYDTSSIGCVSYVDCDKPLTRTDANGNVTSYTYDPTHGGLLTETKPAVNGVSPVTRHRYEQRYAWTKNSIGGYDRSTTGIWLLSQDRTCRTTATVNDACAGGPTDEVVTEYDHGPDSGPNYLMLRGMKTAAYDGSGNIVSQRTCYGYDAQGNRISTTSPRATLGSCQ